MAIDNPKLTEAQLARIDDTSPLYKPIMRRVYLGEASPRGAIKAFCLQCMGGVRADITNCDATHCSLHFYRPYQKRVDNEDDQS